jgi:hypothetical protein
MDMFLYSLDYSGDSMLIEVFEFATRFGLDQTKVGKLIFSTTKDDRLEWAVHLLSQGEVGCKGELAKFFCKSGWQGPIDLIELLKLGVEVDVLKHVDEGLITIAAFQLILTSGNEDIMKKLELLAPDVVSRVRETRLDSNSPISEILRVQDGLSDPDLKIGLDKAISHSSELSAATTWGFPPDEFRCNDAEYKAFLKKGFLARHGIALKDAVALFKSINISDYLITSLYQFDEVEDINMDLVSEIAKDTELSQGSKVMLYSLGCEHYKEAAERSKHSLAVRLLLGIETAKFLSPEKRASILKNYDLPVSADPYFNFERALKVGIYKHDIGCMPDDMILNIFLTALSLRNEQVIKGLLLNRNKTIRAIMPYLNNPNPEITFMSSALAPYYFLFGANEDLRRKAESKRDKNIINPWDLELPRAMKVQVMQRLQKQ